EELQHFGSWNWHLQASLAPCRPGTARRPRRAAPPGGTVWHAGTALGVPDVPGPRQRRERREAPRRRAAGGVREPAAPRALLLPLGGRRALRGGGHRVRQDDGRQG